MCERSPHRVDCHIGHRRGSGRNERLVKLVSEGPKHDADHRKERPSPFPPCPWVVAEGAKQKEAKYKVFEDMSGFPYDPVDHGNLVGPELRKK